MKNELVALLACLILVGAVWASNGNGKGAGKEQAVVSLRADGSFSSGTDNAESEKEYEAAKGRYAESMEKWKEKRGNLLEKGKEHALNAISVLQKMLGIAENKIANAKKLSEGEKEVYAEMVREQESSLDDILASVQSASSAKELIEEARLLKNEWRESRKTAQMIIGGIGVGRMDDAIELGWKAENKTADLVEKCGQSGFDVSQANAHLGQFMEQLRFAEQENEMANQAFGNRSVNQTNVSQGYLHLQNAHKYMVEAKKTVNLLKEDLKQCVLKRGHLTLLGAGWLSASGSGHAEISGNGTVEANFTANSSSGKVTVIDRAGDAVIVAQGGNEVKDSNNTGYKEAKYVRIRVFAGAESVKVSGSRMTVILNGNEIELYAKGTGIAILRGTGTYEAGSTGNSTATQTGTWNSKGAAIGIAAGQG